MKNKLLLVAIVIVMVGNLKSQEKYGNTFNLGVGPGYYGYHSGYYTTAAPALNLNYEFDVTRNFTLAPFVSFANYRGYRYWGNLDFPYRNYSYVHTIIPMGVKGSYYFDELFNAGDRWDFYTGISSGFVYRRTVWENGYNGDRNYYQNMNPFFLNLHAGTELHLSSRVGLFLDLSSGMSTFGVGFHL